VARGGVRVGSGRKPKARALAALHGHRARRLIEDHEAALTAESGPPDPVDPPATVTGPVLKVWLELAPHALAERTLTAKTAASFELLCRAVVLERKLSRGAEKGGSNHRGMMQRVEAGFARFRLAPTGKAFEPPPKPVDPFAEFATPPSTPQ
jgi:hypothetical protein